MSIFSATKPGFGSKVMHYELVDCIAVQGVVLETTINPQTKKHLLALNELKRAYPFTISLLSFF